MRNMNKIFVSMLFAVMFSLLFLMFSNTATAYPTEEKSKLFYYDDFDPALTDGWYNPSKAVNNITTGFNAFSSTYANDTKYVFYFNSINYDSFVADTTPTGIEYNFFYLLKAASSESLELWPIIDGGDNDEIGDKDEHSLTSTSGVWFGWQSLNNSFSFPIYNLTWNDVRNMDIKFEVEYPLGYRNAVYLACMQIRVWYLTDLNETMSINNIVNISLGNGSYVNIDASAWFNDSDLNTLEHSIVLYNYSINESAYQENKTMNNTGFYNLTLNNESWANITWFSWFNDSTVDSLETVINITSQYINNSVGSGCVFPFWFNYSDDNITINVSVNSCGSASLGDSEVNEDSWLFISGFELEPQVLILLLVGLWFWFAEKSKDYILYVFSGITSLVGGVWFFTVDGVNMLSINTWTAIILILFGVYCFFLSLYYGMKYNARK